MGGTNGFFQKNQVDGCAASLARIKRFHTRSKENLAVAKALVKLRMLAGEPVIPCKTRKPDLVPT